MPWFRRRGQTPGPIEPTSAQWNVTVAAEVAREAAGTWDRTEVDAPLLEARLADRLRDVGLEPMRPAAYANWTSVLELVALQRLGTAVAVLAHDAEPLAACTAGDRVYAGLGRFLAATSELPLELVLQSDIRAEEFVRQLAAPLGIGFVDETAALSEARLEQLDYGRLLAEARRARDTAEGQLEYLRKHQEAQTRGRRRGKW